MMKNSTILILGIAWVLACGQQRNSNMANPDRTSGTKFSEENSRKQRSQIQEVERFIYTDSTYTSIGDKGITIQNSFPKGGMIAPHGVQYSDKSGKPYSFAVFWSRLINETDAPVELSMEFPADSFAIFTHPDAYLKLFLPNDTLTYDKLSSFNYGLTGTKSYLDTHFNKSSHLYKTIMPGDACIFFVITVTYGASGTPRAELIMNGPDLYYKMSISPHDSGTIPCGKIAFEHEEEN